MHARFNLFMFHYCTFYFVYDVNLFLFCALFRHKMESMSSWSANDACNWLRSVRLELIRDTFSSWC